MTLLKNVKYQDEQKPADHHIALFYDSEEARMNFLTNYFAMGFERHELCVLVTSMSEAEIVAAFDKAGTDIKPYIKNGQLRIFDMLETYLPNGKFVSEYMLANVRGFLDEAQAAGFHGLRTAGEMNWIGDHDESQHNEAALYESEVNGIHQDLSFNGLCIYSMATTPDDVIHQALQTHPQLSHVNTSLQNPYYYVVAES